MNLRSNLAQALGAHELIAVWGASGMARRAFERWLPKGSIQAVIDIDPAKAGSRFYGFEVEASDSADLSRFDLIIICVTAYLEVYETVARRAPDTRAVYFYELIASVSDSLTETDRLRIDLAVQQDAGLISTFIDKPQAWVNVTFRLARHCRNGGIMQLFAFPMRLLHSIISGWLSIEIPLSVEAGPGLVFVHFGGAVLHKDTRLGSFVSIYQFSTIGSNDGGRVPRIGNFVILYSGSAVLGDCVIGDHSRIGANSVALDISCEPGSTLVGTPARIVRQRKAPA